MELAVYTLRHPERVSRLVQVSPVPPSYTPYTDRAIAERRARMDSAADPVTYRFRAPRREVEMGSVAIRYIVEDVEAAMAFYRDRLGFQVEMHPAPGFAMLSRGDLRLLLNAPGAGGAGPAAPDGTLPVPGGWNRFQLEVGDLDAAVERLSGAGAGFRNEIVGGKGGRQILLEDPSGNPIELFEPPAGS